MERRRRPSAAGFALANHTKHLELNSIKVIRTTGSPFHGSRRYQGYCSSQLEKAPTALRLGQSSYIDLLEHPLRRCQSAFGDLPCSDHKIGIFANTKHVTVLVVWCCILSRRGLHDLLVELSQDSDSTNLAFDCVPRSSISK